MARTPNANIPNQNAGSLTTDALYNEFAGIVQNGVSVSIAVSTDGGTTYNYVGWANRVERGDWTDREWWVRQQFYTPGATFHVCVLFKAAVGYSAKVRNIAVHVTDNVID